jgi:branched-chain amino acid transport system permease protein
VQLFLQQIVEGIANGAIYAAMALALVLVYRATRICNFAQGEMATFSTYLVWQLDQWGLPFAVSLLLGVVASFLIGVIVFQLVIRPILTSKEATIVNVCIGLFIGFDAICLLFWGTDTYAFPRLFPDQVWTLDGVRFSANNVGILFVVCLLALGIAAMFRFTHIGLGLRASAAERVNSHLVGIEVGTMLALGWGLATVCGFVAAVLIAPSLYLAPTMMVPVVIYSFSAATLGGWDSPMGAITGGLIIGVTESLAATFVPFIGAELKVAVPFAVMALVLLIRPQGFFGRTMVVRA